LERSVAERDDDYSFSAFIFAQPLPPTIPHTGERKEEFPTLRPYPTYIRLIRPAYPLKLPWDIGRIIKYPLITMWLTDWQQASLSDAIGVFFDDQQGCCLSDE
jgi:hypothetical protein